MFKNQTDFDPVSFNLVTKNQGTEWEMLAMICSTWPEPTLVISKPISPPVWCQHDFVTVGGKCLLPRRRFDTWRECPCVDFDYLPIRQLDEASRSVFKENVRLSEALNFHTKELDDLRKLTTSLAEENASLTLNKVHLDQGTANRNVAILRWQSLDENHSPPKKPFSLLSVMKHLSDRWRTYFRWYFPCVVYLCWPCVFCLWPYFPLTSPL